MIPFKTTEGRMVDSSTMQNVFDKIKTPHKYGVVLQFPDEMCDSPTVYRHNGKWYMSFIKIANNHAESGYDSHLAESDDLLHWRYICKTMDRNDKNEWDSRQIALYAGFIDNALHGTYALNRINGGYHYAYLGGNLNGYETDPLSIGQCKTIDPARPEAYCKLPGPRLHPGDADSRKGETLTLYKSDLFVDPALTTGHLYVNAYNAKGENHKESIYLAVSDNGEDWERYGDRAIIVDDTEDGRRAIHGDPQILKDGDLYIMLYFVLENGKTYDTFACSYDLVHWTKWEGPYLIESSEEYDAMYAHKPCLVVDNGIVYHFYCAVSRDNTRTIALAASKAL